MDTPPHSEACFHGVPCADCKLLMESMTDDMSGVDARGDLAALAHKGDSLQREASNMGGSSTTNGEKLK